MQLLEERIRRDGIVKDGDVLRVDSFLNHQMDVALLMELAREFERLFHDCGVNKILTVEASGIGVATLTAHCFGCPLVFAKKSKTSNVDGGFYSSLVHSFTHNNDNMVIVSRDYLGPEDKVLIIDDFLANGAALTGLFDIVKQSGAEIVGAGICVEKAFQPGGDLLRQQGYRVESLARVKSMSPESGIEFC